MPNPTPAKYTVQLGPTTTPERAGEIAAWAEVLGMSMSEVARECLDAGLDAKRRDFAARASLDLVEYDDGDPRRSQPIGMPRGDILAKHIAAARERGERQVQRRRDYDERTRKIEPAVPVAPVKGARKVTAKAATPAKRATGRKGGAAA